MRVDVTKPGGWIVTKDVDGIATYTCPVCGMRYSQDGKRADWTNWEALGVILLVFFVLVILVWIGWLEPSGWYD